MSGRRFFDTNIFVYSFDGTAPAKRGRAETLIFDALTDGRGVVSFQVVQEFFSVAFRKFAKPLTVSQSQRLLSEVFRPMLRVHSSEGLYAEALEIFGHFRLSWHDSLIVASAAQAGCSTLYTEDLGHGQQFGSVRIQNPFV